MDIFGDIHTVSNFAPFAHISNHSTYLNLQLRQGKGESDRKRKAFLDHILTSTEGNVLREEELLHELQTLSIAAVGTSMDFMSFFLTCIAMHPDVQDRIHQVS